jgi:hypothetical protein
VASLLLTYHIMAAIVMLGFYMLGAVFNLIGFAFHLRGHSK